MTGRRSRYWCDPSAPCRGGSPSRGGEPFPLVPLPDGSWLALAAIPLGFDQPTFPLDLNLTPADGPPEGGPERLRVELPLAPRERKEQKLALPKEMVDYPPGVAERIDEENARLRKKLEGRRGEFPRRGFVRATAGRVSGEFGNARVLNGQARSPHSGVDIAAPAGQAVVAANDGRVALGGTFYLTGKTLLLDHGAGVFTLYAHLNKIKVNVGDMVSRGDRIGTVGATGRATGPHLHYGAVVRGVKVDPASLDALTPLLDPLLSPPAEKRKAAPPAA